MQYVLIIHEVEAYPAWELVFDQAADIRKSAGVIRYQLLRYADDANNVVHFSQWSSLDNARRFFESPALVEIRKKHASKPPPLSTCRRLSMVCYSPITPVKRDASNH